MILVLLRLRRVWKGGEGGEGRGKGEGEERRMEGEGGGGIEGQSNETIKIQALNIFVAFLQIQSVHSFKREIWMGE